MLEDYYEGYLDACEEANGGYEELMRQPLAELETLRKRVAELESIIYRIIDNAQDDNGILVVYDTWDCGPGSIVCYVCGAGAGEETRTERRAGIRKTLPKIDDLEHKKDCGYVDGRAVMKAHKLAGETQGGGDG